MLYQLIENPTEVGLPESDDYDYVTVIAYKPENFDEVKWLLSLVWKGRSKPFIFPYPYRLSLWQRILRPIIIASKGGIVFPFEMHYEDWQHLVSTRFSVAFDA